ncbi:lipase [Russula earlei]|uniref:Lipase n=1 Tax=Russula earlei TaxID=71964 RepID=A0ACC0UCQ1_9AGAM|nr:lipase [Russula earlei]
MLFYILALFTILKVARAAATIHQQVQTTILSPAQVDSFKPYTFYAAAAYCQPSKTLTWSCGAYCAGNPTFQPYASGGNGSDIQFWYVGWDPALSSVIVTHQGTDPTKFRALLTDAFLLRGRLDPGLFPGLPSSITVHRGFASEHARTAPVILTAVRTLLTQHGASSVVLVGHSLGAALALLDGLYLSLQLPATHPGTRLRVVGYGMPRVGNHAFADYVDAAFGIYGRSVTRINNKKDPIPSLPDQSVGYVHASGEVHIQSTGGAWLACPGQENPSPLCSDGAVPHWFRGNIFNHLGPYPDRIQMGIGQC